MGSRNTSEKKRKRAQSAGWLTTKLALDHMKKQASNQVREENNSLTDLVQKALT